MIVDTVKGCAYVLTCTTACTVHAVFDGASPLLWRRAKRGNTVLLLLRMLWRCLMSMRWLLRLLREPSRDCLPGTAFSRGMMPR